MEDNKLSLIEILNLSYPKQFEWFMNEPGVNIQVNWVVTCVDDLENGDLFLIEGKQLNPEILEAVIEHGGAAVVLVGDTFPDNGIMPEGLPVVSIPGKESPHNIQRRLLNILINKRAFLMERSVRVKYSAIKTHR